MTDVMHQPGQGGPEMGHEMCVTPQDELQKPSASAAGGFSFRTPEFGEHSLELFHQLGAVSNDPNKAWHELKELVLQEMDIEEPAQDEMETFTVHTQVRVGKKKVDVTGEFPEEPMYGGNDLLIPGFGGFKRTSRSLRHAMAVRGQGAWSYEPLRADGRSACERLFNPQKVHTETVEAIMQEVATDKFLQKQIPGHKSIDFERWMFGPHSMGGLPAYAAAEDNPDTVEAVIGLATVGFGSPDVLQIAKAVKEKGRATLAKEIWPYITGDEIELRPVNLFRIVNYYARNPLRTIGEARSCLRENAHDKVAHLKELGIFTAYLAFEHDILVPMTEHITDVVDVYDVMPASGHIAPQLKAGEVADWRINTYNKFTMAA